MFESERRDLAWVPRWSIIRCNRRQSVAEHSYFVTCYGLEIARLIGWPSGHQLGVHRELGCETVGEARHLLALYLLRHDEAEALEGDMPGPVKRLCSYDSSKLKSLVRDRFDPLPHCDAGMVAIRRVADLADECLYLAGELAGGNGTVESVLRFSTERLDGAIMRLPAEEEKRTAVREALAKVIANERSALKDLSGLMGPEGDPCRS